MPFYSPITGVSNTWPAGLMFETPGLEHGPRGSRSCEFPLHALSATCAKNNSLILWIHFHFKRSSAGITWSCFALFCFLVGIALSKYLIISPFSCKSTGTAIPLLGCKRELFDQGGTSAAQTLARREELVKSKLY